MNWSFSFAQIFPSNSWFSVVLPADTLAIEEREANSDQKSMDQPTAGAPRTCWGLSLFLPSVILMGLLL